MISVKLMLFVAFAIVGKTYAEIEVMPIGCYKEYQSSYGDPKRELYNDRQIIDAMTNEKCIAHCKKHGHKYAAAYKYNLCFCGSSVGRFGKADDSMCNSPCSGNNNQTCGADGYNSVFKTNHVCFRENPCMNGGWCLFKEPEPEADEGYQCQCADGYNGTHCELQSCSTNPCLFGGSCTDQDDGGFKCACVNSLIHVGPKCEKKNYCGDTKAEQESKCKNGGFCISTDTGFECLCDIKWKGANCETKRNPCENACMNNGTCTPIDGNSDFKCDCPRGLQGKRCEEPNGEFPMCFNHRCTGKNCLVMTYRNEMNRCALGQGYCYVSKENDKSEAGCINTCIEGEVMQARSEQMKFLKCCQAHECNMADIELTSVELGKLLGSGVSLVSSAFLLLAGLVLALLY